MSTFNDSLEKQIKQQIMERKITPSRDLWADIREQNAVPLQKKSNLSLILAAACVVLTISLSYTLFFDSDSQKPKDHGITDVKTKVLNKENSENIAQKGKQILQEDGITQNLASEEKIKVQKQKIISPEEKQSDPEILNLQTAPKIIQDISKENFDNKIVAKNDSLKIKPSKRKFVDPATLLFSVEHKDAIEKTKGGSNVATIDLNTK